MDISFETPDFGILNELMDKESQKNIDNEKNPRVKELLKEIKLSKDNYEIIQLCARVHELDPDNFKIFADEGRAFYYLNQFERAERSYLAGILKAEQQKNGVPAFLIMSFAIFLFGINKYDEVIACCDKVIENRYDYPTAWGLKGMTLLELKRYSEAIGCSDIAISQDPEFALFWDTKIFSLIHHVGYEEALKCCKEGLEINPKSDLLLFEMAGIYYKLNNFQLAYDFLIECKSVNPNYNCHKLLDNVIEKLNQFK